MVSNVRVLELLPHVLSGMTVHDVNERDNAHSVDLVL